MKISDRAYFAGLFDGEGSVTIAMVKRGNQTVTNMSLRISNNNPVPLWELEEKFGGRVRFHSPTQTSYVWVCTGHKAVDFAKLILPYCRIKTGQLEIYMAFAALKRRKPLGSHKPLTKDELKDRRAMLAKLDQVRIAEGGKVGMRLISGAS